MDTTTTRLAPKTSTPEERAAWAAEVTQGARGRLGALKTVKLVSVSEIDCVSYSAEDEDGYEVRYHVAAPCVRPLPGRSVAQALRELSDLGLVQVERHQVDGRLAAQLLSGSDTYYFRSMTAKRNGKPINFRLDPELAGLVEAAARAEHCTLAEWWTRAARQRLDYHAEVMRALRAAHAAPATDD